MFHLAKRSGELLTGSQGNPRVFETWKDAKARADKEYSEIEPAF